MAGHGSYEELKKSVWKGLIILALVTLIEVIVSLFGKGYLGIDSSMITLAIAGILLVAFSLYKAYYIVYNFMHMGHEVKALRLTVLLPCTLLFWAIIAFIMEGDYWNHRRENIKPTQTEETIKKQDIGSINLWDVEKDFDC